MTVDDVEARLIQAVEIFQRMEGNGRAWATDGPWRMMRLLPSQVEREHIDKTVNALTLKEMTPDELARMAALRPPLPDREARGQAEEAASWLGWIEEEGDRRIVLTACARKARDGRVGWPGLVRGLGLEIPWETARSWHHRGLRQITRRLNRVALVREAGAVGLYVANARA